MLIKGQGDGFVNQLLAIVCVDLCIEDIIQVNLKNPANIITAVFKLQTFNWAVVLDFQWLVFRCCGIGDIDRDRNSTTIFTPFLA